MKSHTIKALLGALLVAAGVTASVTASGQDWPSKPVRLVNPFAPGGSTDIVVRTIAQRLTEVLGQPVVVDAKPGAGTNVAMEHVAKSAPDGHTMVNATSSLAINVSLYKSLPYDPLKDLAPVILLVQSPNALAVHPSLPVHSVKDLIEYARANPGKLNYGSSGNGATNHLSMELFKSMARVSLTHVPYKGGGQALNDLLGGQIQVMFNPPSSLMPHHKAGRVRALAIGSGKRVEGLDLPTVADAGGLPGFESTVWFALFVPAGTPRPIVSRLNTEVDRILKDRQVAQLFAGAGLIPVGGTPEDLAAHLKAEIERWGKVVRESGAKID